jgi:hypothetical protein
MAMNKIKSDQVALQANKIAVYANPNRSMWSPSRNPKQGWAKFSVREQESMTEFINNKGK